MLHRADIDFRFYYLHSSYITLSFYSCCSGKSISRTEATRETPPSPPRYSQGGVVESFYFAIKARLRLGQNKN